MLTGLIVIMSVSVQLITAVLAFRLINVTGNRISWILISSSIFFMAVRRLISLFQYITGDRFLHLDLTFEIAGLITSILMLAGVILISPLFKSMSRDIVERKEAEKALRFASSYNRSLIEASLDPLVTISAAGKITDVNNATERITGYSREKLIGTDFSNYFTDPSNAQAGYQQVFRDGFVQDYALEIRHMDGRITPVLYNASVYRNEDGEVLGVFAAARDITERKKAQLELERLNVELTQKNKELEQVLYVTSHDLRSPLVNIQGFSRELDHSLKDLLSSLEDRKIPLDVKNRIFPIIKKDIPESLKYILTSVYKMDTLLSGLLKLSRMERSELIIDEIDMNKLFTDIINNLEYQIKEAGVKLETSELPTCRGDKMQINQVFSNLMENALKFLDPDRPGVINISGNKENNQSVYCVEDNGIGIAPEHQMKIFEMFYQLDPAVKGEGLGLTIVHKILGMCHGKIWIESETDKGSKFYVSLPC